MINDIDMFPVINNVFMYETLSHTAQDFPIVVAQVKRSASVLQSALVEHFEDLDIFNAKPRQVNAEPSHLR